MANNVLKNAVRSLVRRLTSFTGPQSDPDLFGTLEMLPNPDQIMRKMGKTEQVFASIKQDSHIKGLIRPIRADVRRMNYRLKSGDEEHPKAEAALDLCKFYMNNVKPNATTDWKELFWQFTETALYGFRVHELVWDVLDGYQLPCEINDRPNRRFGFDADAALYFITKNNRKGELADMNYFVVSQHMATMQNPYGEALFSSCFWWWTFKNGGVKFLYQYCERHGLPWPIARYPEGTQEPEINELEKAIQHMIGNGYAVVQDGTGVEILETKGGSGDLPQERLILLANREMSMAITSQSMVGNAAEVGGTMAASTTAKDEKDQVSDGDRDIAIASMNQIFRKITDVNIGTDVPSPVLEFYTDNKGTKERAEVYQIATQVSDQVSKKGFHDEMGIPVAEDENDILKAAAPVAPTAFSRGQVANNYNYATPAVSVDYDTAATNAIDQYVENKLLEPAQALLQEYIKEGKSVEAYRDAVTTLLIEADDSLLQDVVSNALAVSSLEGINDA